MSKLFTLWEKAINKLNSKADLVNGKVPEKQIPEKLLNNAVATVKDYGAKGDGTTDDTAAFQTALAENRLVYVPEGTYKLSDTLTIEGNCELELAQSAVLEFTQTDKHCIAMKQLSSLKGNHSTINVPYNFSANVIHASTELDSTTIPPFKKWSPQWKNSRYVTDINICKPDSRGFHYSVNGDCYGTAVYLGCYRNNGKFMWGVNISGVRIAGGFTYGIHIYNQTGTNSQGKPDNAWNHDMRIEAVMDACETGVLVENCNNAHLAVTIQPRRAYTTAEKYIPYAKYGIKLVNSKNIDLSSSCVWDWNDTQTLWAADNEHQHLVMIGQCRGLVLSDFLYYESSTDIRELIYTDTPSNLENMTILQEPVTRWFKPVDSEPFFFDGYGTKRLALKSDIDECFQVDRLPAYTNVKTPFQTDVWCNNSGIMTPVNGAIFIEPKAFSVGDVVRIKGIDFTVNSPNISRANMFKKSDGTYKGLVNICAQIANGEYTFYNNEAIFTWDADEKLLTVTFEGSGAKDYTDAYKYSFGGIIANGYDANSVIVTVNEEISYTQAGFLADAIKVKAENVIGLPEGGGGVQVQSDLTQNDETAPDYIKGRTHWSEEAEVTVIDNLVLAPEGMYTFDGKLITGQEYTVILNGVESTEIAQSYIGPENGETIYIGDSSALGVGDSNGKGYCVACTVGVSVVGSTLDEEATLTVKTMGEIVHTIPQKYLNGSLVYVIQLRSSDGFETFYVKETAEQLKQILLDGGVLVLRMAAPGIICDFSFDSVTESEIISGFLFSNHVMKKGYKLNINADGSLTPEEFDLE